MMQNPWRRWVAPVGDLELPKRRTQSSSAELQPSGSCRRQRLLAKDRYRIVVMGAAAVGKTCIISRLLYERFVTEYQATVEELHCGDYELDGRPLTLDILDTSGTCRYVPPSHPRGAPGHSAPHDKPSGRNLSSGKRFFTYFYTRYEENISL